MKDDRKCGSCHACCVALAISETGKPAGVACPQLGAGGCLGCAAYGRRAEVVGEAVGAICDGFRCAWLFGHGTNGDRPDKSGVILVCNERRAVTAFEVWPGSLKGARANWLIRNLLLLGQPVLLKQIDGGAEVRQPGGPL